MTSLSYTQITEKFLEFEKTHDLLNLKICGTFPWQICRISIFLQIINHHIPGNVAPPKHSLIYKIKTFFRRILLNSLIYNPFFDRKQSDILIFESGRKYPSSAGFIDIYTYYICRKLSKEGKKTTVYEMIFNDKESILKRNDTIHLDAFRIISYIKQKTINCTFSQSDIYNITSTIQAIKEGFGINIDLQNIFKSEIKRFKSDLSLYQKLLQWKKPKEIFIINSCDKPALVYAAKQKLVLVNELQHGLNSDKDVVLNFPFPEKNSLAYFPDRFYIWNNVDMFFATLPISENNIFYFPNYHLEELLKETAVISKEKKTLLFVSQPTGSSQIQEFLLKNIAQLSNYTIYYKVHPAENKNNIMKLRICAKDNPRLNIIDNEESVYTLLKRATFVVGVYSSALFEATAFDCKIILLNLPGVEMSFPLLKQSGNQMVNTDDNLRAYLEA